MKIRTAPKALSALVIIGGIAIQAHAAADAPAPSPSAPGAAVTTAAFITPARVTRAANNTTAAVQDLVKQAADLRGKGDYDGVISVLTQAIQIDGKNADLYADLADAQAARGRFSEAVKNYTLAVGDDPGETWSSSRMEDGDIRLRFALLLEQTAQYDQAAEMYKKGYEDLVPEEKKALPSSFSSKDLKNDKNGARADFAAASRTLLGMKYSADGFPAEATAQLEAALAAGADYAPADYFLANCRLAAGKKADAVALWQKAVSLGSGDVKKMAQQSLDKAQ